MRQELRENKHSCGIPPAQCSRAGLSVPDSKADVLYLLPGRHPEHSPARTSITTQRVSYMRACFKELVNVTAGSLEASLQQRAKMGHTGPTLRELAAASKSTAQRARVVLATVNLAGRAGLFRSLLQGRFSGGEGQRVTRQSRSNALSSSDDAGA